jgi:uncharacterized protein YtpQ (UPF0354 family)
MNTSSEANARLVRALACVKTSAPASQSAGGGLPASDAPVVKDLGHGLVCVYLVDDGQYLSHVQQQELAESEFTAEGLHECAVHNLARSCEGKARVQQHGPVYGVFFDGMFEASLLLADALWDVQLAHLAPNGFVAALPARDVLAFCDEHSAAGVAALRDIAKRVTASGDHLLTAQLYARRSGQWVRYN